MYAVHVKMYVADPELRELYEAAIVDHNTKCVATKYPDSGFDLITPEDLVFNGSKRYKIDLGVVVAMSYSGGMPTGFSLEARSSFSKYPLIVTHGRGIIDSGYRGTLKFAVKCDLPAFTSGVANTEDDGVHEICERTSISVSKDIKLCQIVAPGFNPLFVTLVDTLEDLGITERGDGGFGSTSKGKDPA